MAKPKILFVVPTFSEHDQFVGIVNLEKKKREVRAYPYLGVLYLIAGLKHKQRIDYDVDLIDAPAENLTVLELAEKIKRKNPTIMLLTCNTFTLRATKLTLDACRKEVPEAKIILGGIHINHSSKDIEHFDVDYGLKGDCEFTIKPLVEAILEGTSVKEIPGAIYKENGKFCYHPETPIIKDLDSIPFPDRTTIKPEHYVFPLFDKKFTTMISTRGCPFACAFCGLPYNKKYYKRSPENVVEEMKQLESLGYEFISFCDDVFTIDRRRIVKFCEVINNNNLKVKWGCSTRADVVDYELLKLMKDSGCIDVRFGVESGSEKVRFGHLDKKITNKQYYDALNWCKEVGLFVTGFFLFGHYGEKYEDMEETVRFAKSLNFDAVSFGIVVLIPRTEIYKKALEQGKVKEDIWKEVLEGKKELPFYCPEGVSLEAMRKLRAKANWDYYIRTKYIVSQFMKVRNVYDFVHRAKTGVNLLMNRG